jgi:beta-lactamase class A
MNSKMKRIADKILVFSLLLLVSVGCGQNTDKAARNEDDRSVKAKTAGQDHFQELPLNIAEDSFTPLRTHDSPDLRDAVLTELKKDRRFAKLIGDKNLCLGLVDLHDPANPRYAGINGDHMLYAASMPKIAVLLAAQEGIENGYIDETPAVVSDMNRMIRYSDNAATTRVIDLLGYDYIEQVLRSPKYGLYDEGQGGGLWVGKRYARSGDTNREPLKNLSHAATAFQACRFYYNLVYGRLVSRERSVKILEIMTDPGIHHKFVHTLDKLAPNAKLYRKSGSWKVWHADSVLIWDTDRKYILVAIVKSSNGEQIVRDLVGPVERGMYKRQRG